MSDRRERESVLFANEAFYDAFRGGDFATLDLLWARRHPVACIHPGWQVITGREAVMESWQAILRAGPPAVRCLQPQVLLLGDSALVLCYEEIDSSLLAASNLFVPEEGGWRLVHHQAGPTPLSPNELDDGA